MADNACRYSGTTVVSESVWHWSTRRLHSAMVSSGVDGDVIRASLVGICHRQHPTWIAMAIDPHVAMGSQIKSVPAQGREGWDAWEAPPAKRHRRIVILSAATLPPITRLAFGYRYSQTLGFFYSRKSAASGTAGNIVRFERRSRYLAATRRRPRGYLLCIESQRLNRRVFP